MGKTKQLLPLGGKTIIEHSLDNLLSSKVDEVIVVTGNEAEMVAEKIANRPVKIVINSDFRQGMSTSLKKGVASISRNADAITVALADQPFISSSLINRMIEFFKKGDKGIVVPAYKGRRGHPIIFNARYRDELLKLEGDAGAKVVLERHPEDILEVEVSSGEIHIDIDDMESYGKWGGRDVKHE